MKYFNNINKLRSIDFSYGNTYSLLPSPCHHFPAREIHIRSIEKGSH